MQINEKNFITQRHMDEENSEHVIEEKSNQ